MGDSFYDMFLKEHEKYFPIHAMIQSSTVKPKTPYQLDLEVKDRKPSIVPKVGDRVKIKSRAWYEKWKDTFGVVYAPWDFTNSMAAACGNILEVERIESTYFYLKGSRYCWSLNMFEEVFPVLEPLSSKKPRIDLNSPYLYQSPFVVKGSELVLTKEEQERLKEQFLSPCSEREKELPKKQSLFAAKIEETAKRLASYSLVQGLTANPKLKQIKTTRLIKLKKL